MEKFEIIKIEKPWGYELIYAHTDQYVGKILFVKKGQRLSLQYHAKKDETVFIHQGRIKLEAGKSENELRTMVLAAGSAVRFRPRMRHRIEAIEDTTILEASTPELDDVIRLSDDYGRIPSP